MTAPILTLRDIHLTFGGTPLLEGAELYVARGDRLCLVGRNGSGKSTLLKIAAGLIEPDRGEHFVQPGSTIHYLAQEPDFAGHDTVFDAVCASLADEADHHLAYAALDRLDLSPQALIATLSGGEMRRAALAAALAARPDILLLDEPTNHLDLRAIEWLEAELSSLGAAIVMISHDRRFLAKLARAVVWLDRGATRLLERGFAEFETWRDDFLEEEARDAHKLERKIAAEEDWLRYGVTARRKRNQHRLANLHALRAQRHDAIAQLNRARDRVDLATLAGAVTGKLVIEAENMRKAYGDTVLIDDFSLRVARGDRVGIMGPNGAGKSTLISLLTRAISPDSGTIRLGPNLEIVTLDQRREALDPEMSLQDAMTGGGDTVFAGGRTRHIAGYMKDFLFAPEQRKTPLSALSGGERGRVMLARALARPSGLLVLDEPTNDLDLETLDLLQEMLSAYQGTLLLVSHDRDFIDRIVSSVVVAEGDGRWREYAGGYSDMLAQRPGPNAAAGAVQDKTAKPAHRPRKKPTRTKRKLSFKEARALEGLPEEIAALEAQIKAAQSKLDDAGFYATDPEGFNDIVKALERDRAALADAEQRWLELEMMKELLAGEVREN